MLNVATNANRVKSLASEDTEHVRLQVLWNYSKSHRRSLSPEQVNHIVICSDCTLAAILCRIHRSIDTVRRKLELSR